MDGGLAATSFEEFVTNLTEFVYKDEDLEQRALGGDGLQKPPTPTSLQLPP